MTVRKRKEVLAVGRMDGSFQMAANMAGTITKLLLEMGRSRKDLLVDTYCENWVLDPRPRNMISLPYYSSQQGNEKSWLSLL